MEWTRDKIDVLGLAWDGGLRATATNNTPESMAQFLDLMKRAEKVVGQNVIDADCMQLEKAGHDISWLYPKILDTRLAAHATHGHLAGTGSYDLRSLCLLLNGRQGYRFPLDFKHYESDLHHTCAMDASAALWCYPTLQRLVTSWHLESTVAIAHRCAPIFALMHERGIRLDKAVLEKIYVERKTNVATKIEQYGLWEERGKKVIKRVPIWRSPKVLDLFEQRFGIRPANLQRQTWVKLRTQMDLPEGAGEFIDAIIELGKGANDAHWLGKASETADGIDFSKVGAEGKIYPRYDICGSPDRAIASSPNIQNFPRPSEDPRPIPLRSAVIPLDDSHCVLGVDFSSIETLTNAYESQDMDRVIDTLQKRVTHEGTARIVNDAFGLSLSRQQGKAINHGFDKGECVAPDTLILKADLTWVAAAEINVGDEIIGFDEQFHGKKSKYRRSIVHKVSRVTNPCYLVETDKGNMTASTNHAWLVRNFEHVYKWKTTDKLKVGQQLKFFGQPWITDTGYIAGRLAGFFDGEGAVSRNGETSAELSVSQNIGTTLDYYRELLTTLGYPIRERNKTNKNSKCTCVHVAIRSRYAAMRFLGSIRPIRLTSQGYRFWENASVAGGQHEQIATILRITFLGNGETVAIRTSTKTLITNGFLTHNSPYNLARTLFKTERPSRQQVIQCQTIFQKMLSDYPKTAKFRDQLWERSRENPLVVTNSFGRRLQCFSRSKYGDADERWAKHVPGKKYWCSCGECAPRRDRWKYAIAFLGRSAAFDALLRKMAVIWEEKRLDEFSLPYMEIHDELDFSVPICYADRYSKLAIECFQEPIPELGGICLPAEAKIGRSWADAH